MNKKWYIIFLFILAISIGIYAFIKGNQNNTLINYKEEKIEVFNEYKNKVKVYFPNTKYSLLNRKIKVKIERLLRDFNSHLNDVIPNQYFSLDVNYDTYNYYNIISFVFNIESFYGGAHPDHEIWTISYDTKNNKVITIDSLLKKYPNILNKLSNNAYNLLKNNPKLMESSYSKDMLIDGTKPLKENFNSFAFTDKGLIIFFQRYQIAPYSMGDFHVIIPYDNIF